MPQGAEKGWTAALARFLDREPVKIVLSGLIIVSVLPDSVLGRNVSYPLSISFLVLFSFELAIRAAAFPAALREGKARGWEIFLFLLDAVATLSFLPLEGVFPGERALRNLRLVRLMRLLLLLRFWGPVGKEIWVIVMKRKYQVLFALSVFAILLFTGGALLSNVHHLEVEGTGRSGYDFNQDGRKDAEDAGFGTILWWSLRQIMDPGNMMSAPRGGWVFVLSLVLAVGGVFILSFIIGIGTTVVGELVDSSRSRPIGMKDHNAVLNISASSHLLLSELELYYRKHLRKPRLAVLGAMESKPEYLFRPELSAVRFRQGSPSNVEDLRKVDVERARRVILLGDAEDPDSDARVVSQVLSVRQMNPEATILAEIREESNLRAAREAGGPRTVPLPMSAFTGLFLAAHALYPGIEALVRDLLTPAGYEIYTFVYGFRDAPPLPATVKPLAFGDLALAALSRHGVVLLGLFAGASGAEDETGLGLRPWLNPPPATPVDAGVRGFVGLAKGFEEMRALARDFAAGRLPPAAPSAPRGPAPAFRPCPASAGAERVLVCNFPDGTAEFVEQMLLSLRRAEIFVMVPPDAALEGVGEALLAHSRRPGAGARGRFERTAEGILYRFAGEARPPALVRVFPGSVSDEDLPLETGRGPLSFADVDLVVFSPETAGKDPDAGSALSLLKVWGRYRAAPEKFRPSFRILAETHDPDKAELLERRALDSRVGDGAPAPGPLPAPGRPGGRCRALSVLSREWIRNEFLAQAIFVPGIAAVYRRLLGGQGEALARLLPEPGFDPDSRVGFDDLFRALYARDRVLLLGVEVLDPRSRRPVLALNPRPGEPFHEFRLGDLVAVCVVGDPSRFSREGGECFRCLRPRTAAGPR